MPVKMRSSPNSTGPTLRSRPHRCNCRDPRLSVRAINRHRHQSSEKSIVSAPPASAIASRSGTSSIAITRPARAEKAGIVYGDVWEGFIDEAGKHSPPQGSDYQGQICRLRTGDGIHFTKFGARKLALYVEREIERSLSRVPVALPVPADQAPSHDQRQARVRRFGRRPDPWCRLQEWAQRPGRKSCGRRPRAAGGDRSGGGPLRLQRGERMISGGPRAPVEPIAR